MGYEDIWYTLVSFAVPFSFIIVFGLCLCGCRKQTQKNDLLGLAGMVKITNPDENVNNVTVLGTTPSKDSLLDDESKRLKVTANPHRSLPDIPVYSDGGTGGTHTESSEAPAGDIISELYATVGDQARNNLQNSPRARVINQSNSNRSSVHQHGLDNQTDDITSPYATVRNPDHTYNRVHISEHPYAQLQNSRSEITGDILNILHLPNSQRNSVELLQGYSDTIDGSSSNIDIPAAPAIAGRVSANQELPYMTPPIQNNTHFSGDSQDSSKGYTSISVREPLVNILAQVDQSNVRRPNRTELVDSHYATVSDDSDEMYAAIDEPFVQTDVYTSVSDTYAQIQPPVENVIEINHNHPSSLPNNNLPEVLQQGTFENTQYHSTYRNKDVDNTNTSSVNNLQHLTQVHSRQDSSSSCVSSVGNLGSPKPEKRQANSPLPPPPSSPTNFMLCKPMNSLNEPSKVNENSIVTVKNSVSDLNNVTRPGADNLKSSNSSIAQNDPELKQIGSVELDAKNMKDHSEADVDLMKIPNLSLLLKNNPKSPSAAKDLEEMYAKVVKKNKNLSNFTDDKINIRKNDEHNVLKCGKYSEEVGTDTSNDFYESDSDITSDVSLDMYKNKKALAYAGSSGSLKINQEKDPGYETIHDKNNASYKDPGYETIDKNVNRDTSITDIIPEVPERKFNVTQTISMVSSNMSLNKLADNSNYEAIHSVTNASSDSDPNYEVLRPPEDYSGSNPELFSQDAHSMQGGSDKIHGYSTISELVTNNNTSLRDSAGYSIVNKNKVQNQDLICSEHNYESLSQYYTTTNSECDPNYESVEQLNLDSDPPYTRLIDESPASKCDNVDHTLNASQRANPSNKNRTDEVDDYFQV